MKYATSIFLIIIITITRSMAQNSVGIGVSESNNHAVLELVSPTNNQGFLVPRVSTEHRLAMQSNLGAEEIGLMIFDNELNQFYFWNSLDWEPVGSGQGGGSNISFTINDNNLEIADENGTLSLAISELEASITDTDAENELQDLSLNGTVLEISNGQGVDLDPIIPPGGTDDQNLILTGDILSIEDGTGNVDLSDYIDDADANASNELVGSASLEPGNILRITDAGGNHDVDLSALDNPGPWSQDGTNVSYTEGNVGIGITSPLSEFNVHATDGLNALTLTTENVNEDSEILLGENSSGTLGMKLKYDGTGNIFQVFGLNTNEIGPHLEIGRNADIYVHTNLISTSNGLTTFSGANQILSSPSRRFVKLSAGSSSSSLQRMFGGVDGKEIIISNSGSRTFTIRDRYTSSSGHFILMDSNDYSMYTNDTLHVIYDDTVGAWVEIGRGDNHGIIIE